jgi:ADP-heptose:LPS heptosyltransferase
VVRAGALGDVLLLRPTVAALNRAGYAVTLLAPVWAGAALVGPGPAEARALIAWDRPEMAALFSEEGPPAAPLHQLLGGFDVVLAFTRNRRLIASLSSLNTRVLARDPQPPTQGPHASAWLAGLAGEAGSEPPETIALLQATAEEQQAARAWRQRLPEGFIAVHPGSGSPAKNWPAERFGELLQGWASPFLLVEGPADAVAAAGLRARPDVVAARDLSARVLGALLAPAALFVGNDSGVTHLAAAWGAPTLALFGPTEPALWAPLGPRVAVVRAPGDRLDRLPVATVRAAAESLREPR